MLIRRAVTASDVPTLCTPAEMKPPTSRRREAFYTSVACWFRSGINSARSLFHLRFSLRRSSQQQDLPDITLSRSGLSFAHYLVGDLKRMQLQKRTALQAELSARVTRRVPLTPAGFIGPERCFAIHCRIRNGFPPCQIGRSRRRKCLADSECGSRWRSYCESS